MMLIIADKKPEANVEYLAKNTNKNFMFKSLLELAQLICSCGFSEIYKPVAQGKELQKWIDKNKLWTHRFYTGLWYWCLGNLNLKAKTLCDLYKIGNDLYDNIKSKKRLTTPKTGIFRFSKEYKCKYESNTELPIDDCIKQYKKYINWKFKNKGVKSESTKGI